MKKLDFIKKELEVANRISNLLDSNGLDEFLLRVDPNGITILVPFNFKENE